MVASTISGSTATIEQQHSASGCTTVVGKAKLAPLAGLAAPSQAPTLPRHKSSSFVFLTVSGKRA